MTELQFAYLLQGFAELNEAPPTPEQWKSIREHLALVFTKVTPKVGGVLGGISPLQTTAAQSMEDYQRRLQNNQTVICGADKALC